MSQSSSAGPGSPGFVERRSRWRRSQLLSRTLPFGLIVALGWATVPLAGGDIDGVAIAIAGVLTMILTAAVVLVPWSRYPPSYALVVPFGSLLVIALLREAVGGATSGYGVLVLAPVLWLALYASRRALILLLVCVVATLAVPILIAGEPNYPDSEWRRVVLITAISAVVGLTTQALVTEVRARAARERRRESYIRAVMNSASEGIVAIDVDGHATFANRAAARLTGYSIEEMVGARMHDLVHHSHADGSPYPIERCPTVQTVEKGEETVVTGEVYWRKDGSSFPVEYRSTPMIENGEVVGVVNTFIDISERLAVERLKNEFVSVVSHELRTPLTSIRGSLGLMEGGVLGELSDEAKQMLGIAITNADRLVRLINDILDAERIESGKAPLEMRDCDLGDLMEATSDLLAPAAAEAGTKLTIEPLHLELFADPDRITQTLVNLVGNAIKFTPEGGSVTVTAARAGDVVAVRVSDDGPGIPDDKKGEIFSRFAQLEGPDTRATGGSGLGLAIARGIVQQHGGRIWIEDREGGGSVFAFELPLPRGERTHGHDEAGDGRLGALIVEDDADLAEVLAATLDGHGVTSQVVGDVADALRALRTESPELIVLDLRLPGSDGRAVIERMRSEHRLDETAILVYTARDLTRAELAELEAAAEVVTKSKVTSAEFEQLMVETLERARA